MPHFFLILVALLAPVSNTDAVNSAPSRPYEIHRLRLFNTHTNEHIDVVYREGDDYVPEALDQLNHFLRDTRTGDVHEFDPKLFDLLTDLEASVGEPDAEINVVCGYRTPQTNRMLRQRSRRVAKHSLHMQAMAMDIRLPGVTTAELRDAALSLGRGGVGYYRKKAFVHVDVGPVRQW